MAITDYSGLVQAVKDFAHRSDLTNYMDTFIGLAEDRMAHDMRVRELEATTTGTLSGITLNLPADYRAMRRFTIDTTTKYSPEIIGADGLRSKYTVGNGIPNYAAIVGSNIEFNRTPDSAYTYTLDYYTNPEALTSTNTTTDMLTRYPGIYLYSTLMEVAIFTKNDQDFARYGAKYRELVNFANHSAKQSGPMRIVRG